MKKHHHVQKNGYRRATLLGLLLGLLCGAQSARVMAESPGSRSFVRPGIFLNQEDLAFIATYKPGDTRHPLHEGFEVLRNSPLASLDYAPEPEEVVITYSGRETTPLKEAGETAYAHALLWIVTGDDRHRDHAIAVLNSWSSILKELRSAPGGPPEQNSLEISWHAPTFVAAAEILRHYPGGAEAWPAHEVERFDDMIRMFLETLRSASFWGRRNLPNQPMSEAIALMAVGIYLDDREVYEAGLRQYKHVLPFMIVPSGEIREIRRTRPRPDWPHARFGLEAAMQGAELAYIQGDNAFEMKLEDDERPRLLLGMEWIAGGMMTGQLHSEGLGRTVEFNHRLITQRIKGYDMVFRRYRELGWADQMPYTVRALREKLPPSGNQGKHHPWGSATHRRAD